MEGLIEKQTENQSSTGLLEFIHSLAEQLKIQRFSTAQEKRTQVEVESFLKSAGYSFEREKRLCAQDIPDFYICSPYGGVALEVKTRFPKKQIYRQLERYAAHNTVKGIILLTGTSMGLPAEIAEKPAVLVSLGEGWL